MSYNEAKTIVLAKYPRAWAWRTNGGTYTIYNVPEVAPQRRIVGYCATEAAAWQAVARRIQREGKVQS